MRGPAASTWVGLGLGVGLGVGRVRVSRLDLPRAEEELVVALGRVPGLQHEEVSVLERARLVRLIRVNRVRVIVGRE